jgi:hypothetical protein
VSTGIHKIQMASSMPNEWLCPITLSVMRDPVIAEDGHSYERSAIEQWFGTSNHSPKTGAPLRSTHLIPNHALRNTIEDFFRNHPRGGSPVPVTPGFKDAATEITAQAFEYKGRHMMKMSVSATGESHRQPTVFIAIVDNSGSMGEPAEPADAAEKYGYTRQDLVGHGLNTLATILGPDDMMAIVKFSTTGQVVLRPTLMNAEGKVKVKAAVESIRPDSQTNIYDGCRLANEIANQSDMEGRHIVGILLTDGFPNVSPPRGIIETLKSLPKKNPWSLSTFGFGYNLDSVLLTELAAYGKGVFGFIPDCTMVGTVLINFVANMLSTATRNAVIEYGGRHIDTGPIQFGQTRDFVVETSMPACRLNGGTIAVASQVELTDDIQFTMMRDAYMQMIATSIQKVKDGRAIESNVALATFITHFGDVTDAKSAQLLRDVKSTNESERQVTMAFSEKFFAKWGEHYLRSYLTGQQSQQCMNFKDPGLQIYGGDLFHQIQTEGDTAFTTLPPPLPTGQPPQQAGYYGYRGAQAPIQTPVSMASWHNQSGGCFNGECMIRMGDGTYKLIKDVVAEEQVWTPGGPVYITAVVVCGTQMSSQPMSQIGRLSITPWHPIQLKDKWIFPAAMGPYTSRPIKTVYNFVLPSIHIVDVEGIECCTLGHGYHGPVIGHPFFGTERVIDCLKALPGWSVGRPEFTNLVAVRDSESGLIVSWEDQPM